MGEVGPLGPAHPPARQPWEARKAHPGVQKEQAGRASGPGLRPAVLPAERPAGHYLLRYCERPSGRSKRSEIWAGRGVSGLRSSRVRARGPTILFAEWATRPALTVGPIAAKQDLARRGRARVGGWPARPAHVFPIGLAQRPAGPLGRERSEWILSVLESRAPIRQDYGETVRRELARDWIRPKGN